MVQIKAITEPLPEVARLLETVGACPPEDVEGFIGCEEHINILKSGTKQEIKERIEWMM